MTDIILKYIFPCFINMSTVLYVCSVILNKKIDFKNNRTYKGMLYLLIFSIFNYLFIDSFIRIFILTIFITIIMVYIFKDNIKKTFISVVIEQCLMLISEIIFTFFAIILFNLDKNYLINEVKGAILTNFGISLICVIIVNLKFIKNSSFWLLNKFKNVSPKISYILMLIIIFTMNVLLILVYYNVNTIMMLVINSMFILIYTSIVIVALNEKSENIKFKKENEILLDNLNEYEKMLDYQRVNNHENKNQLLVIRSMISKNNKKALNYLDEIIKEKRSDDEGIYKYAKIIPEGGLQGLVYQKMLKMKENKININLDVDRKIKKVNFDKISTRTKYDLCRIVGVILDNAIEEVVKLKEKEILIYMYKDEDYFIIEVSNKCKNIPDLSKLGEKGYTTKNDEHGYGLSLLKQIISNNENIINERSINKDIFTQIIKLKM